MTSDKIDMAFKIPGLCQFSSKLFIIDIVLFFECSFSSAFASINVTIKAYGGAFSCVGTLINHLLI
jgi:hypothetical protein